VVFAKRMNARNEAREGKAREAVREEENDRRGSESQR